MNTDFTSADCILEQIAPQFATDGRVFSAEPYGNGHINSTFAAKYNRADGTPARCIIQRINTDVFRDPNGLMDNIERVTDHLRKKISAYGGDPERETMTIIPTVGGAKLYRDGFGQYWRSYVFIEDTVCYQNADKPGLFGLSGRAFGKFTRLLDDFPAESLVETIPNFHNTESRFDSFLQAVGENRYGRRKEVQREIDAVMSHREIYGSILRGLSDGSIPLRVTHNDTKLNNILMDKATGEGVCIIDLDTVMPGSALYDFGDSIRFGASTAAEDERDLDKVHFSLPLFEEYTAGYLTGMDGALCEAELDALPLGAVIMTLECGMRFLTDYLNGDTYFKTTRDGQNLDRARTQLKLADEMKALSGKMADIVAKYR